MGYFGHGGYELRDIHDWNHPLRWFIDLVELPVLGLLTLYGFERALVFGRPLSISWHDFWQLISGAILFLAGVLLLRDWGYGYSERAEEQKRRKLFEQERARIVKDRAGSE